MIIGAEQRWECMEVAVPTNFITVRDCKDIDGQSSFSLRTSGTHLSAASSTATSTGSVNVPRPLADHLIHVAVITGQIASTIELQHLVRKLRWLVIIVSNFTGCDKA